MQDFVDSSLTQAYKRRASDLIAGVNAPANDPLVNLLKDLLGRIEDLERDYNEMTTAFILDDLKRPDFGGHRKSHITLIKAADVVEGYKHDATKVVLKWILTGILAMFMGGVGMWITGHFK